MSAPRTMRALIAYKAIKGTLQLAFAVVLSIALRTGQGEHLHQLAGALREYVTARIAVETAEVLLSLTSANHLELLSLAFAVDGAVGIAESWLLRRGQTWALWLVAVATALLIPWEVFELVHRVRITRVVLLLMNIAVVAYLSLHARKHTRRE